MTAVARDAGIGDGVVDLLAGLPRELPFAAGDFERVRRLIRARAGIALGDGKASMVYGRLAARVRASGCAGFGDWLDRLERASDDATWQDFVNALTTNLTAFFREAYHFPLLAERLRERARERTRIWCAAASTGEEPWSLAMTAVEALGPAPPVDILATDIDTTVLAAARAGVYEHDPTQRGLDDARLRRFFLRGTAANAGRIRVKPELARMVTFERLNLVEAPWRLPHRFDVVFCRNVMIYFDRATQAELLARLHAAMAPGGLLFVGHSENLSGSEALFALRGKTVYERIETAPSRPGGVRE